VKITDVNKIKKSKKKKDVARVVERYKYVKNLLRKKADMTFLTD
jgi:hypothetical protein